MEIDYETRKENVEKYISKIKNYANSESIDKVIKEIGGVGVLEKATFATNVDSGLAFDGSLVKTMFEITTRAVNLANMLPTSIMPSKESIAKVGLLHHIAKSVMLEENDNNWEIQNRGLKYKFTKLDGALKLGERSLLMCMNAGITFTEEEFEAMRILDKGNDDVQTKCFMSPLSMVIKMANEMIVMEKKLTA